MADPLFKISPQHYKHTLSVSVSLSHTLSPHTHPYTHVSAHIDHVCMHTNPPTNIHLTHINTSLHNHTCINTQKHPYIQHTPTYISLPTHSHEHRYTFYTSKCLSLQILRSCARARVHTHKLVYIHRPIHRHTPYAHTISIPIHTYLHMHTHTLHTHAQPGQYLNMNEK